MKNRFPAALAKEVVRDLLARLNSEIELTPDGTRWVKVAGSLRRRKDSVGDVELVYVPRFGPVPDGLFVVNGNRFDHELRLLIQDRVIAPRLNAKGSMAWGDKNKLAIHCETGLPIDFFSTTVPAFWNYLVCRTGSAENNTRIASAAQERGLMWHPYHCGFEVRDAAKAGAALTQELRSGQVLRVEREQDVFTFCGLDYLEPWER